MTGHNRQGVALLCDTAGVVRRVIHDDLDLPGLFVVGRQLMDITAPASAGALAAFLAAVSDRGAAFDREVRIRTSDQEIALYVSAVSEGDHLYLVAARSTASLARLHEDLILINNEQTNALRAALKELGARQQREMAKKNIELEQLNALKNELLGMAAHDLRSPLGVIQNYSDFLEADAGPLLNDEQRAVISTIKRTSRFMLSLVDDLLDVSTIEAGRLTLDRQPCDPGRLLTENVTLNRTLAARKTIAIDWTAPERPLPTLQLDAGRIEQVLNNLIGNAMKFASPGSRVSVSATTDGDEVTISIADQGPGIPPGDLPNLFKPFARATARGTAGEKSTGLGLAIVRKIIEAHGGRIWVDSEPGRGATFRFALPIAPPA